MSLINAHTDVSSRAKGLIFVLSLHLHLHSVHASSEGSGADSGLSADGCTGRPYMLYQHGRLNEIFAHMRCDKLPCPNIISVRVFVLHCFRYRNEYLNLMLAIKSSGGSRGGRPPPPPPPRFKYPVKMK